MSLTNHAVSTAVATAVRGDTRSALEAFWARAELGKLEARFAVSREMEVLPQLPIQALRAIALQYRYFTQAFATDLALLVVRCPEGRLRSLLGQLVNEELGGGDPEAAHLRLYDRFLESIGAIEPGVGSDALAARIHPRVRELLADLGHRTRHASMHYAIGMRGMGGECVCGVYFSVMHVQLRKHPFVVANESAIDWRFWDIHAGHADLEHNQLVRAAVAELLDGERPEAVNEVAAGYDHGTATWDEFWSTIYADHVEYFDATDGSERGKRAVQASHVEHVGSADRGDRGERGEHAGHAAHIEHIEGMDRGECDERGGHAGHAGHAGHIEHIEGTDRGECDERGERADYADRAGRGERTDHADRVGRGERAERAVHTDHIQRPA